MPISTASSKPRSTSRTRPTTIKEVAARAGVSVATVSRALNGIGPVKQMVLSCDREAARRGVSALLKGASGSVRNEIETLARKIYLSV